MFTLSKSTTYLPEYFKQHNIMQNRMQIYILIINNNCD